MNKKSKKVRKIKSKKVNKKSPNKSKQWLILLKMPEYKFLSVKKVKSLFLNVREKIVKNC